MLPFFGQIFPPSMLDVVADFFDLVAPVHEFQPSQVAGVISTSPIWKFGDRNIIIGHSGSGKTRILEALKQPLTALAPVNFKVEVPETLSPGQKMFIGLETLLQTQPPSTCLVIDDALGQLDELHLKQWCDGLKSHDKQVVIATGEIAWRRVAPMLDNMPVTLFRLELPQSLRFAPTE